MWEKIKTFIFTSRHFACGSHMSSHIKLESSFSSGVSGIFSLTLLSKFCFHFLHFDKPQFYLLFVMVLLLFTGNKHQVVKNFKSSQFSCNIFFVAIPSRCIRSFVSLKPYVTVNTTTKSMDKQRKNNVCSWRFKLKLKDFAQR